MKVIIDTNLWISFLIGHHIVSGDADLTDLSQHNNTKIIKLADLKEMMLYI